METKNCLKHHTLCNLIGAFYVCPICQHEKEETIKKGVKKELLGYAIEENYDTLLIPHEDLSAWSGQQVRLTPTEKPKLMLIKGGRYEEKDVQ